MSILRKTWCLWWHRSKWHYYLEPYSGFVKHIVRCSWCGLHVCDFRENKDL